MKENRPILFRAKDEKKNWVFGWPIFYGEHVYMLDSLQPYFRYEDKADLAELIEVDPDTLCEYTGAHDRRGNPIYEYDIVRKRTSRGMENRLVCFNSGYFHCGWGGGSSTATHPYLLEDRQIEIVGNKFDDPSLLGGKS